MATLKGGVPAARASLAPVMESVRAVWGGTAASASRLLERKRVVDGGCNGEVGPEGGRDSESNGIERSPDGNMSRWAAMGVAEYMCIPPAWPIPDTAL